MARTDFATAVVLAVPTAKGLRLHQLLTIEVLNARLAIADHDNLAAALTPGGLVHVSYRHDEIVEDQGIQDCHSIDPTSFRYDVVASQVHHDFIDPASGQVVVAVVVPGRSGFSPEVGVTVDAAGVHLEGAGCHEVVALPVPGATPAVAPDP
jgi:hypothetical protein